MANLSFPHCMVNFPNIVYFIIYSLLERHTTFITYYIFPYTSIYFCTICYFPKTYLLIPELILYCLKCGNIIWYLLVQVPHVVFLPNLAIFLYLCFYTNFKILWIDLTIWSHSKLRFWVKLYSIYILILEILIFFGMLNFLIQNRYSSAVLWMLSFTTIFFCICLMSY